MVEVVVARIGRPHGVRGDVSIELRTDDPDRRLAPGAVLRTEPADAGPLTVVSLRAHGNGVLMAFEGCGDRAAAERLRDTLLLVDVPDDEEPEDPEEFYDRVLVGLQVVTTRGAAVGEVAEVLHLPGQDVLAVRRPAGPEVLVPFVTAIVPEVDVPGGRIVIDPPPGLLHDSDATASNSSEYDESAG